VGISWPASETAAAAAAASFRSLLRRSQSNYPTFWACWGCCITGCGAG
jgi:hypothetical protein